MGFIGHIDFLRHTAAVYTQTDFPSLLRIDIDVKSPGGNLLFTKYGKNPVLIHPVKLFRFCPLFFIRRQNTAAPLFFLHSSHQLMGNSHGRSVPGSISVTQPGLSHQGGLYRPV